MTKIIRSLHRDLGYFAAGIIMIYAISGFILVFRDTDFLKHEVTVKKELSKDIKGSELGNILKIKNFNILNENEAGVLFNNGAYNKNTGEVEYTINELVVPFNYLTKYHKMLSSNSISWVAMVFAAILFFQAISSFWMFPKNNKNFLRGIIIAGIGLLTAIIVIVVT